MKGEELFRDQVLATKFFVPVASHALIPRPRLIALLDACPRRPLTLVSAPAGFGKTTLLSEWVQALSQESIQVAWVSLDEGDNNPVRFWRYVLTALDRLQPGMCTDLVTLSRTQTPPPLPSLLTTLINRLVQSPEQVLLVLDDYHMITDQAVHTSFTSLLEHLPAQLRVVLSTRVDPPLPLSRLRARSQLLEVRTKQLRCTGTEVADFLHEIVGVELSGNEVEQVTSRTGGWLVSLQMLEELKRANLFLISLDSQRRWYRYHPLFTEALRFWLERVDHEALEVLHLRASAWYAEHGYSEEAIQHALLAHAWQQAADLIEAEMRVPNQGRADEASVQDDGNHLLWDFRALHTSFGSDGQVSPVVSERAQAAQVEVLRAQAKPGAVLKRPAPQQDLLDPLSVRELEVLQLMAQGATNQGIARALTLAIETVKRHVSNIISKLGACNRTQAVVRAHSLGLLS